MVWIVNLKEKSIEVYRDPNFTGYASNAVLRTGDHARIQAFPEVAVDLSELMRR